MIYLIFSLVALATTAFVCVFGANKGVIDCGNKLYKKCVDDIIPFKGIKLILIAIFCFAVAVALQISLYKNTSMINFVKLYGVFVIVFSAAVVDLKRKIIPNILIILGMLFRVSIYGYEIITDADIKSIVINDLIGFGIGFVLLAIISLLTKGALGFGDAKLFGVIGIISGSFCTYSTLFVSLIISVIVSIIGLARKKMG